MAPAETSRRQWRQIAASGERRGRDDVALYAREPSMLPSLPLGGADEPGRLSRMLRTTLLAVRFPPTVVAAVGALVPGRGAVAWLRFAGSYAYWTGVRRATDRDTWRRLRRGVLILLYHGISARGELRTRYIVPVNRFQRQMRWLKRRRYNVIGLHEYLGCRAEHRLPPPKTIVLTFDDGYLDNLTLARPILERLELPATIFLVSSGADRNTWSSSDGVAGRPLMSLDAARQAHGGLLTFGAHTRTHPKLPEISRREAQLEVRGSKQDLEAALGVPVPTFAYPYGRTSADVRELVADSGFAGACTTLPGRNRPSADDLALRRVEIFGTDRLPRFALIVWLGGRLGRRYRA